MMSVEMQAVYVGNLGCEIRMPKSDMLIYTDASPENTTNFSPTDVFASSLAACTLSMMAFSAQKDGIDLKDTSISFTKEIITRPIFRVAKITLHIQIKSATPLTQEQREKLQRNARGCPVRQSISPDVSIEETFAYL